MEEESVTVTEGATPAGEPESSPVNSGSDNTTPINCVWLDGVSCCRSATSILSGLF